MLIRQAPLFYAVTKRFDPQTCSSHEEKEKKEAEERKKEADSMTQGIRFQVFVGVRRFNLSVVLLSVFLWSSTVFLACGSGE